MPSATDKSVAVAGGDVKAEKEARKERKRARAETQRAFFLTARCAAASCQS